MDSLKILFAGESWFTYSVHQKGFDTFETAEYTEGATQFLEMLAGHGHEVTYVPAHKVDPDFPADPPSLARFDVVVLSDVGSNTFLLPKGTFSGSAIGPNRLEVIRKYVAGGGGLLMIGGYMSFSGIGGRARYGASPLADVLPVVMSEGDDRIEVPEGFVATVAQPGHPALAGVPGDWPHLLGYNRFSSKDDGTTLVRRDDDPILVVGGSGEGRTAAIASDLAPHWAPPEFVAWDGYSRLWLSLLAWLGRGT
jgi:uncharacterized membrane protein